MIITVEMFLYTLREDLFALDEKKVNNDENYYQYRKLVNSKLREYNFIVSINRLGVHCIVPIA